MAFHATSEIPWNRFFRCRGNLGGCRPRAESLAAVVIVFWSLSCRCRWPSLVHGFGIQSAWGLARTSKRRFAATLRRRGPTPGLYRQDRALVWTHVCRLARHRTGSCRMARVVPEFCCGANVGLERDIRGSPGRGGRWMKTSQQMSDERPLAVGRTLQSTGQGKGSRWGPPGLSTCGRCGLLVGRVVGLHS